jgi:hypothetical protein
MSEPLKPWTKAARRLGAVYRERYSKETRPEQFEAWIKEACEAYAKQQRLRSNGLPRGVKRIQGYCVTFKCGHESTEMFCTLSRAVKLTRIACEDCRLTS